MAAPNYYRVGNLAGTFRGQPIHLEVLDASIEPPRHSMYCEEPTIYRLSAIETPAPPAPPSPPPPGLLQRLGRYLDSMCADRPYDGPYGRPDNAT